MAKSRDAFRTISEVADWLDTPAHVLRFWESKFTQVKPVKRAGGRRYYRPGDMALLGGIKKLLHDDGLTIKGVQKILREQGVKHVSSLCTLPVDDADDGSQQSTTESPADAPFEDMASPAEPEAKVLSFARPYAEAEDAAASEASEVDVEDAESTEAAEAYAAEASTSVAAQVEGPSNADEALEADAETPPQAQDAARPDRDVPIPLEATEAVEPVTPADDPALEAAETEASTTDAAPQVLPEPGGVEEETDSDEVVSEPEQASEPDEVTKPEEVARIDAADEPTEPAQADGLVLPEGRTAVSPDTTTPDDMQSPPEIAATAEMKPTMSGLFSRAMPQPDPEPEADPENRSEPAQEPVAPQPPATPDGAASEPSETTAPAVVDAVDMASDSAISTASDKDWPPLIAAAARLRKLTPEQAQALSPHVDKLRALVNRG